MLGAFANDVLSLFVIDDHMRRAQLDRIIIGIVDGDIARMMETVTQRHRARGHAMHLAVDHIVAKQGHDTR